MQYNDGKNPHAEHSCTSTSVRLIRVRTCGTVHWPPWQEHTIESNINVQEASRDLLRVCVHGDLVLKDL